MEQKLRNIFIILGLEDGIPTKSHTITLPNGKRITFLPSLVRDSLVGILITCAGLALMYALIWAIATFCAPLAGLLH